VDFDANRSGMARCGRTKPAQTTLYIFDSGERTALK
jgi:hypothetical protein